MSGAEITEEYIDRELREMHKKMTELFQVDFPYFKNIIIIEESKAGKIITEHIRLKLKEKGVIYNAPQWAQIREHLSGSVERGFFENMAFYDEKEETMYVSQNLLLNHPDKVIPTCVHELAEILISTLIPSPSVKESAENLLEKYINSKDPTTKINLDEFQRSYKEIVFKSVFKEGCCEAIALRTLMHSSLKDRVEPLEEELQRGHSKWIDILFNLENMKPCIENQNRSTSTEKDEKANPEDVRELLAPILKRSQAIKSISYHLGYPIAKEIIEKHGIEGIKAALINPPLKAEYFVDPSTYVSSLKIKNS